MKSESEISISMVLKRDSRNRVSLTKLGKKLPSYFKATLQKDNKIVLEPIDDKAPKHWLMKPENKHLLEKVDRALNQKETVDWDKIKNKYKI